MRSLPLPSTADYRTLIVTCASSYAQVRTANRRQRIIGSIDNLLQEARAYDTHAQSGNMHCLNESQTCGLATDDDLVNLYETKLVRGKEGSLGRERYLAIRDSAPRGICPLCCKIPVTTLDHYLPKSKFPAYAVYPRNLVPSCKLCNDAKSTKTGGLTLHPYYDNVENARWLKCSLWFEGEAVLVEYGVWQDVSPARLRPRMINHLNYLGISDLYRAAAIDHLIDIKIQLVTLGEKGGRPVVEAYLQEERETRRAARINSWATALYDELCSNEHFLRGGYRLIESP